MYSEDHFRKLIEIELEKINLEGNPPRLYAPIRYMIELGGKRMRPALLMMCNELFDGNAEELINPALGIEIFHNFTLLHDDIMDKAPLRRNKETVHSKWGTDIAILSGDTMFVKSCQLMMQVKNEFQNDVLNIFFKTAIEVCEGQQMDMDFETGENISIEDYLNMISLKTASLIGCAAYIGAICAGANKVDANHLYEFGKNLGIAFQLQDDILDVFGDSEKFGKQVGGDILANKKTILLLTALQKSSGKNKTELHKVLEAKNIIPQQKIDTVIEIYKLLDVKQDATDKMDFYLTKCVKALMAVNSPNEKKLSLQQFAEKLMTREN